MKDFWSVVSEKKIFKKIAKKYTKLPIIQNRGSTPIWTILVVGNTRDINTKFEATSCSGLKEVKYVILQSDI